MAASAFWKGYMKLALVTCPVAMTPATSEAEKIRFHTLNRKTGNRIVSQYVDAETGKPLDDDDQVKGYQRSNDEFVMLEDDELDAVALETTRMIDLETFAPRDDVAWTWLDKPHYLAPNDPVGEEAFVVIREAMKSMKVVGLSRLVLYRRERPVLVEPRDAGMVLWTLRQGDEMRAPPERAAAKPDAKALAALKKTIEKDKVAWSRAMLEDPVQKNLAKLIERHKSRKPAARRGKDAKAERPGNVIDITEALRKSLAAPARGKRSRG